MSDSFKLARDSYCFQLNWEWTQANTWTPWDRAQLKNVQQYMTFELRAEDARRRSFSGGKNMRMVSFMDKWQGHFWVKLRVHHMALFLSNSHWKTITTRASQWNGFVPFKCQEPIDECMHHWTTFTEHYRATAGKGWISFQHFDQVVKRQNNNACSQYLRTLKVDMQQR